MRARRWCGSCPEPASAPPRAGAPRGLGQDLVALATDDPRRSDIEGRDPGDAGLERRAARPGHPREGHRVAGRGERGSGLEPRLPRDGGEVVVRLERPPLAPVRVERSGAERLEPSGITRVLRDREGAPRGREPQRRHEVADPESGGEAPHVAEHRVGIGQVLGERDAAGGRPGVELVPHPVHLDIQLRLQPDQAAPLRDEAERSDEVGEEPDRERHAAPITARTRGRTTPAARLPQRAAPARARSKPRPGDTTWRTRDLPPMTFAFRTGARDPGTRARRGTLTTARGVVETPAFMPVGTRASVTGLTPDDLRAAGAEMILANTYHLLLRPGPELFRRTGGIHGFMRWDRPVLTESGGFQI